MAVSALEEKINKIRQQNEEIKRRYEEVEEDKKNAAKLNALVQMVPSTDWPERKEPPEFSNPPKTKQKSTKEKHEYSSQSHTGEGKKVHSFAQGEGPPPDPKYNFLADSEREEPSVEYGKETVNRSHHKVTRGSFRKRTSGRDGIQKDTKSNKGNYRDESQPGYDAWRAERNRIDEDRISRQRTAEGNWRREWDNDKVHIIDDVMKKSSRPTLGDIVKKDYKDSDKKYHANNNEHVSYGRGGGYRPYRGSTKNFYSNYENRSHNTYDQHKNNVTTLVKTPVSPTSEKRTVIATEKSIKVTVSQSNVTKGPVMSVKVNSMSIAGTGRVGPRQRTRVTYSHSDVDVLPSEGEPFFRQKSFEDKSKGGTYFNNQKFPNLKRSHSQKKKENETKYQHHQKKDSDGNSYKHYENEFRSHPQKDQQKSHSTKSPKLLRANIKIAKYDSSNVNVSQKHQAQECLTSDEVILERNVEHNIEHNVKHDVEQVIDHDTEHDIEQNVEHDIEQNIEHNDENDIKQNNEHNFTAENIKILQETKSKEIKVSNIESEQTTIEDDITYTVLSLKEAEREKISLNPGSDTDNLEYITKDEANKSTFNNKDECSGSIANNVTEDLQKSSNKSSKALVPNIEQSNEELVPNENNKVLSNVVDAEEAISHKNDQQSLQQIIKQFVNNDCDNIENKVTEQQSTEEVIDNALPSLEDKTHTVIDDINNQSVCNNDLIQKEALDAEKQTNKKNESSNTKLEDSYEINSESTLIPVNVHKNLIENKEKTEEIEKDKEHNENEESDKPLQ